MRFRNIEIKELPPPQKVIEVLRHHRDGRVNSCVDLSPDGRLAVAGYWGSTCVLEVDTGKSLHVLSGWLGQFTPDGKRIVTCGKCIRVYDSQSGKLFVQSAPYEGVRRSADPEGCYYALTVLSDGRRARTNSDDQRNRLWDLETGELLHSWRVGQDPPPGALDSDPAYGVNCRGQRQVEASADGTVIVMDRASGKEIARMSAGSFVPNVLSISQDGRFAAACAHNQASGLVVWRLKEPPQLAKIGEQHDRHFFNDLSEGYRPLPLSKGLSGWFVEGDERRFRTEGAVLMASSPDWKSRGYLLCEGQYENYRLRFDCRLEEGANCGIVVRGFREERSDFERPGAIDHPVIKLTDAGAYPNLPSGSTHWVMSGSHAGPFLWPTDFPIGEWNTVEVEVKGTTCRMWVNTVLAVSLKLDEANRSGQLLAGLARKKGHIGLQANVGTARFRNVEIKELPPSEPAPARGRVSEPVEIRERLGMIGHTAMARTAVFSPDGKSFYSCGDDRTVRKWDTATGKELRCWDFPDRVLDVALLPEGKGLLALTDRRLYHWRQDGDQESRGLDIVPGSLMKMAANEDGSKVVAGALDGSIHIWNIRTGKVVREWQLYPVGHPVNGAIAWSADGTRIVTGGDAGGARGGWVEVWDAESGDRLRRFENRTGTMDAAFTPDGRRVVSSEWGGLVQVRDVDTGETLRAITVGSGGVGVVLSPDGRRALLLPGKSESAALWDLETGRTLTRLDGRGRFAWDGAILPRRPVRPDVWVGRESAVVAAA